MMKAGGRDMAIGRKQRHRQQAIWLRTEELPRTAGHVFYDRVNRILAERGFDDFAETACKRFYAEAMGRPSLAPGIYFRMQLVGYFEGIDSERGMAWRCADSLSLREFIGVGLTGTVPDHSTVSRTRRLIDLETHGSVFSWMLGVLAEHGLVDGKTVGVDASTLEANAAMRSIVRRDTGESYTKFLEGLAHASGIETPTREDLARLDKNRPKKGSNEEWEHPDDPDAAITKMKDGRTHLAHKVEHAVDLKTGAVLAVTVQAANSGDTTTLIETLIELGSQMETLESITDKIREDRLTEVVADKGYHSNDVLTPLRAGGVRTYISEPKRGRRHWIGKAEEQKAVYANRRRIRGDRGKELLRQRGMMLERPFAHCLETGGLRRVYLRGRRNILKRMLVHYAAFNLSLILRQEIGKGTPRGLQGLMAFQLSALSMLIRDLETILAAAHNRGRRRSAAMQHFASINHLSGNRTFTTGC
jgi:transposase